jgi:hypothetical protein
MRSAHGMTVAILGALMFPFTAHASTHDGAYVYVFGVGVFAFIMGIAAATKNVTNEWRRTGIFFASAGICALVTWVGLMLSWADDRPFAWDLLGDTLVFTFLFAPIPFIAAFAFFSIVRYFTKRDDPRDQ